MISHSKFSFRFRALYPRAESRSKSVALSARTTSTKSNHLGRGGREEGREGGTVIRESAFTIKKLTFGGRMAEEKYTRRKSKKSA